jgi:hypothetical protein
MGVEMERVDLVIKKYYGKLSKNFKLAFMAVMVVGLIAHIYMFTNKLPNFDDLIGINSFGVTFKNGRWFLWVIGAIMYHLNFCFSLPWINGIVTLVLLGITAGIMADMLNMDSAIYNILMGAAIIAFPSWTGTFFYMFTAPYYAVAILLSLLAVMFSVKWKWGIAVSSILLACSLGIYQAYLPFTATLYVVLLINMCFREDSDWKDILRKAVYYLSNIVCGVVIYFALMKLSLALTHQSLNTYKGISSMGAFKISRIPDIFRQIWINFFGVFLNNNLEISYNIVTKFMYLVLMILTIYLLVRHTAMLVKRGNILNALALIVLSIAYVLAVNGIFIMCEDGIYSLMYFSYVFMIIFPLCILDKSFKIEKSGLIVMEYITVFVVTIGIASYCHFANGQYVSIDLSYRQAESYYNTLITQIKSADGYKDGMPVLLVDGNIVDSTLYHNDVMDTFSMSGRDDALADAYSKQYFIKYYCGFDTEYVGMDEAGIDENLINELPVYPNDGAIQVINGVVVVKLSDEVESVD